MAALDEPEKMFDGKHLEPAARNGGTFHSRLGPKVHPLSICRKRRADAGCRK